MSPLCAVVLFCGVSPPRSVSSPSLSQASLLCLASSYPPPKVTFPDASSSVSKSCDSFLSVTFVDPSFPASLSGGIVEVPLPACVSSLSTSLSMSLSPFGEVVSLVIAGGFSSSASMRCLTAMCSLWSLVLFQICSILGDSSGSSLRTVIIGVHAYSFGCAASPYFAAPFLHHIQIGFLTCVSCRFYLIMGLSFVPNFAFLRPITAVCRSFVVAVELISAFGAVSLVSLYWWQIERKLSNKSSPVILVLLGLCCPIISFMEKFRFPKFPLLSGLDAQASPVLPGSSSWLMLFSAIVAFFATPRAVDAVNQEAFDIVIFRFLMVSFFDLCQSISKFNHCLVFFMAFVALLWCDSFLLDVIPPLVLEFEAI
ncbi:hypothetical protein ISN45_Aa02g002160 [Arabidopsis thaliana x Arabidopsis arenosa]|uniref:Transmembrane protein n=1 Tax=Arabidopsis thaliana x Arabidopsis arenosa TaxID=1240361 RepID=A0A8T2BDB3_9BRAS|nr:hypothetical protein ISN45_Aa02g002160 [Arabidopsis thaliana x Arabidopsis arenosa]